MVELVSNNPNLDRKLVETKLREVHPDIYELAVRRDEKPNWTAERGGLTGRAWIGRFCKRTGNNYNFRDREVFFVIERYDRLIATGALKIWRGVHGGDDGGWDLEGFVRRGDESSHSEHETAVAVARIWGTDDEGNWRWNESPFCYGYLCSFDRLVIDAKRSDDVEASWQIIDALLTRIRHGVAVMVLKAFPLEYEGKITAESRPAFEQRARALARLYQRRLGFKLVPHKELADEGWMLRPFKDVAWPDADIL
jgi:hypothetical protein